MYHLDDAPRNSCTAIRHNAVRPGRATFPIADILIIGVITDDAMPAW
jgi:hypothetical protein